MFTASLGLQRRSQKPNDKQHAEQFAAVQSMCFDWRVDDDAVNSYSQLQWFKTVASISIPDGFSFAAFDIKLRCMQWKQSFCRQLVVNFLFCQQHWHEVQATDANLLLTVGINVNFTLLHAALLLAYTLAGSLRALPCALIYSKCKAWAQTAQVMVHPANFVTVKFLAEVPCAGNG